MPINFSDIQRKPGSPLPYGATIVGDGVQFSIFSRHAESVSLILFKDTHRFSEYVTIPLDSKFNRTGDIWHIWIQGASAGQQYGYKMDGPFDPKSGHRYNKKNLLLDPYAKALTDNFRWNILQLREERNNLNDDPTYYVPRSIVINPDISTKIEDNQLQLNPENSIIYELHVKGFTIDPSSQVNSPGTYKGIIEKIPYLKKLGITSVELLPVQEFDEYDNTFSNPETGEPLKNYWGYNTIAFFVPKGAYSSGEKMGGQINEFKEMVKSLHDAGIEVILDVVFNHTPEGDERGPILSFKGIDNSTYYMLEDDKSKYKNYSGCGNTFNCNHPFVREYILNCLIYCVIEMAIDGFMFDLASILGRYVDGQILSNPPLIERIEDDPILRNTKIIAEAWDAAGAYQLGQFPGRWQEWNGQYRDSVRAFWRGDDNTAGNFATRLCGSSDLYWNSPTGICSSVNFITCHDGFTLNDLVSYNNKHNMANGENNNDGENYNISTNCGYEGPTSDPLIQKERIRRIKNFIATLFLSQGTPMILMGDEYMRTQNGNNNTYCQDNPTSWMNWEKTEQKEEIFSFTKRMIAFRKFHPVLRKRSFLVGEQENSNDPDIIWHGNKEAEPDWSQESRLIVMQINGKSSVKDCGLEDNDLLLIFNSSDEPEQVEIPKSFNNKKWKLDINTFESAPKEIKNHEDLKEYTKKIFTAQPISVSVFIS
jgi:glycogen operon protein